MPTPTIHGIQVGRPQTVDTPAGPVETAIFKAPVAGPVRVAPHNLDGDGQADRTNHGGENKAVYAYPLAHYAHWAVHLGRAELEPGQFGENLTVADLDEADCMLGERWHVGDAVLTVAQPRKPCAKLGLRVGDPRFVKAFLQSGHLGMYLAVAAPGTLTPGATIERDRTDALDLSVREVWALAYDRELDPDPGRLRAALAWPRLGPEWVRALKRRLGG